MLSPRLKTSKKWTAFPTEYTQQMESVFQENFAAHLTDGTIKIEGRIYPQEILLRVGYHKKGELRQANFEVSMEHSPAEQDALERINNCVDAAASMLLDYFEAEEGADFPYVWQEFPFQDKKLYCQFTSENSELEKEADRLLGLAEEKLLHEDDTDDDQFTTEEALEAEEETDTAEADDETEPSGPRMFGSGGASKSKKKKGDLH